MVDFQNDFCRSSVPGQDLAQTRANAEAARRANVFAGEAARLGVRVIYSQQSPEFLAALADWDIDGLVIVSLRSSHGPGVGNAQQRAGRQRRGP